MSWFQLPLCVLCALCACGDECLREAFTTAGTEVGAHDENRIEFTTGRDLVLDPKQGGIPLNYFIYPYAEADWHALTSVERSFAYRDVAKATINGGRE